MNHSIESIFYALEIHEQMLFQDRVVYFGIQIINHHHQYF